VSLEFLRPDAAVANERFKPVARSPMEPGARAAGARFEIRDGWRVAVTYGSGDEEADACRGAVGWVDVSHQGKLELQAAPGDLESIVAEGTGGAALELGRATRAKGAWWCPLTPRRAIVVCPHDRLAGLRARLGEAVAGASEPASLVDVTTVFAALTLVGPLSRDVFARFCAVDLRPQATPVAGLRPGSIARQPGLILREADERFLFLFGWAIGQYMWTIVDDAARHLGGRPVGMDALDPLEETLPEAAARA
jgi:heterotetrameric sarcosine oxidase gamma subunit